MKKHDKVYDVFCVKDQQPSEDGTHPSANVLDTPQIGVGHQPGQAQLSTQRSQVNGCHSILYWTLVSGFQCLDNRSLGLPIFIKSKMDNIQKN